ncbi:MAG: ClbS/DfsB family four-helix bundle protein [Bacteroidota bacterium]
MPRPKSKPELLAASKGNRDKLLALIQSYSEEQRHAEFPEGTLNRNIRDVMTHLHEWHLMMLDWYKIGMSGKKPAMPAEGYTWKTLPALNRKIWQDYQGHSLEEAIKLFEASHRKAHKLIEKHSEEDLFTKKKYKWTGSTSLGAYLISNTSSHYDWGIKIIKKSIKALQK